MRSKGIEVTLVPFSEKRGDWSLHWCHRHKRRTRLWGDYEHKIREEPEGENLESIDPVAEHQDIIVQEVQRRLVNVVGIRVELWHSKHRESQEGEFHGICLEIHSKVLSSFYQDTLVLLHEHCTSHHWRDIIILKQQQTQWFSKAF